MPPAEPIVIRNLSKSFGKLEVLRDLDLTIPVGSVTALLGRNGAGKTTLLRILTGLLPRDGGDVDVLGSDPRKAPTRVKSLLGYVPDETPFNPKWRVSDALDIARSARRKDWDLKEEARLREAFELSANARIGRLSKGMRAKLALLLGLAHRPRLVLLDEPAGGLDPVARREVLAGLVDVIHEEGRTVLLSSHRLDDVERLADRVAFLQGGRIVLEGKTEEVRAGEKPGLEELYLSLLGEKEVQPCGA